jgi:hypothetical protein
VMLFQAVWAGLAHWDNKTRGVLFNYLATVNGST